MNIIELSKVRKVFGEKVAVNDLSLHVAKGSIYGLLGPNGAGKTTSIRMITNIYMPDAGEARIKGEKVSSNHQNIIGYLPEERGLYKKQKVLDQLAYFGQIKGMKKADAIRSAQYWLNVLDASDWASKKVQELSKGMQQKVQFIATILHDPEILILDEPFSGFDPVNVELLKKIILDQKAAGKTIILSTHVMHQVEQMCDEFSLINNGKAVLSGTVRQTKKNYGRDTILIEFEGDDSFLSDGLNVKFINKTKSRAEFRLTEESPSSNEILRKAMQKAEVYKYELVEPSLHEIFIDVVSNGTGGENGQKA